jgi:hypothetical protein
MLIVDDILFFPFKGILSAFEEIHKAAKQEQAGDEQSVRAELTELYMMLETRKITEDEFNARETELLDRLERLQAVEKVEEVEEVTEVEEVE